MIVGRQMPDARVGRDSGRQGVPRPGRRQELSDEQGTTTDTTHQLPVALTLAAKAVAITGKWESVPICVIKWAMARSCGVIRGVTQEKASAT